MEKGLLLMKMAFVVLAVVGFGETTGTGECFDFPTLDASLALTVKEHDNITIPFQLRQESQCSEDEQQGTSIYISGPANTEKEFCILRVERDGGCRVVFEDKRCQCPSSEEPNFKFTLAATSDDGGYWTWKAGDEVSHWTRVFIEVQPKNGFDRGENRRRKPQERGRTPIAGDAVKKEAPAEEAWSSAPVTGILEAETERGDHNVKAQDTTVPSQEAIVVHKEGAEAVESSNGLATFGAVFVGVNVFTVIAVATIVYVLRGRRERKRMRNPGSALPPTPKQPTKTQASRPTLALPRESTTNSYIELPSRPGSSKYERISALIGGKANDGYEVATVKTRQQVTLSGYEIPN